MTEPKADNNKKGQSDRPRASDQTIARWLLKSLRATLAIVAILAISTAQASPTECPFVDTSTGLRCLGVPMPVGVTVAGTIYRCSNGHEWVERD